MQRFNFLTGVRALRATMRQYGLFNTSRECFRAGLVSRKLLIQKQETCVECPRWIGRPGGRFFGGIATCLLLANLIQCHGSAT